MQKRLFHIFFTGAVLGFTGAVASQAQAQSGPDLTVDAARLQRSVVFQSKRFTRNSCAVEEQCVSGTGRRSLMRFDLTTPNIGTDDLVLGAPALHPELFTYSPCHGHYHFNGYASYQLLTPTGDRVVAGRKQAFCLLDYEKWDPNAGPAKFTCSFQGISAGWADTYRSSLDCQWLDVTDVAPGPYLLRATVNPEFLLDESDYSNNSATVPVTVPSRIR